MKLRCINEKRDDLHAFAESFLGWCPIANFSAGNGLDLGLDFGGVQTSVLQADGRFQVEAVMVGPNVVIPDHTHPNVDTIEYPLAGLLRLTLDGIDLFPNAGDDVYALCARRVAVRIDRDQIHGGKAGPGGALFLSIQRWDTLARGHVGRDWRGATVSPAHEALAKAGA